MTVYDRRLLTPPDEKEEIYPYRRVWRSLVIENVALLILCMAAFVVFGLIQLHLSSRVTLGVNGLLIAFPVIMWFIFSVWSERSVPEPRHRLIAVFVVSALAANALAIPFIEQVMQPEKWLPLGGAINRIIGYTFTVGIIQETTKYAVVRFLTWPEQFRTRLDSVAYCASSALGYAVVLNARFLLNAPGATPDVVATQVFNNVAVNLAASLIVSYGLSEVRFDKPTPFLLTITVAFAALVNGIVIPLRSGLTNATFVLTTGTSDSQSLLNALTAAFALRSSTPKPILGLGFSAAILVAFAVVVAFLFNNAERQAREALAGREV